MKAKPAPETYRPFEMPSREGAQIQNTCGTKLLTPATGPGLPAGRWSPPDVISGDHTVRQLFHKGETI